jgi:hypothetical protein
MCAKQGEVSIENGQVKGVENAGNNGHWAKQGCSEPALILLASTNRESISELGVNLKWQFRKDRV